MTTQSPPTREAIDVIGETVVATRSLSEPAAVSWSPPSEEQPARIRAPAMTTGINNFRTPLPYSHISVTAKTLQ
jgi:hypothetical protein